MSKLHLISSKLGEQVIQMPPLLREKSYQISGDPSGKGKDIRNQASFAHSVAHSCFILHFVLIFSELLSKPYSGFEM